MAKGNTCYNYKKIRLFSITFDFRNRSKFHCTYSHHYIEVHQLHIFYIVIYININLNYINFVHNKSIKMAMCPRTKQKVAIILDVSKAIFHWGFIPAILFLG